MTRVTLRHEEVAEGKRDGQSISVLPACMIDRKGKEQAHIALPPPLSCQISIIPIIFFFLVTTARHTPPVFLGPPAFL